MCDPPARASARRASHTWGRGERRVLLAVATLLALTATACGGLAQGPVSGPPPKASLDPAADSAPGVTAKSITLGVVTDLTGPVMISGTAMSNAVRLYFDELNAAGGVCGRTVQLEVRDHGYNVDRAVTAYTELKPQVLGFAQILGASMVSALQTNIESDRVLTAPAAWSSTLLTNPYIAIVGTTYDIESINAMDHLVRSAGLKSGDRLGHIYLDNEYGRNALRGSTYAAAQLGVTVKKVPINPSATTFAAEIDQLKRAGVKAVLLSTLPPQTAAVVGPARAAGLNVPFVGNSPTFSPTLLKTPAAAALQANFKLVSSFAPFSADLPEVKRIATGFRTAHPQDEPDAMAVFGYAAAEAYASVLRTACERGDLSREGLVDAFRATTRVDTKGLIAPLDFSHEGAPATRQVYVSRPDPNQEGGLTISETLFASDAAMTYIAPAQKR